MLLNFLNILIIFSILFGLVWFIVQKTKNRNWVGLKRSEHIKVIDEGIQMGFGQKISIIKVEKEYFLYTYGQSGVAFQRLKATDIESQQTKWEKEIMGEEHQESFKALGEVLKNEK
jgi:flagellar biogenesis protein FliO